MRICASFFRLAVATASGHPAPQPDEAVLLIALGRLGAELEISKPFLHPGMQAQAAEVFAGRAAQRRPPARGPKRLHRQASHHE